MADWVSASTHHPGIAGQATEEFGADGSPGDVFGAVSDAAGPVAGTSAVCAAGVRIAVAMTTTTPSPIRMSPTLKTFENGSQAGRAKMSVSQGSAGSGTNELFE